MRFFSHKATALGKNTPISREWPDLTHSTGVKKERNPEKPHKITFLTVIQK